MCILNHALNLGGFFLRELGDCFVTVLMDPSWYGSVGRVAMVAPTPIKPVAPTLTSLEKVQSPSHHQQLKARSALAVESTVWPRKLS